MRITVVQQFHNPGHSRTFETAAHWPSDQELHAVCRVLSVLNLPVAADRDGPHKTVHVRAGRELSTVEEVTVLRAFAAVCDARLVWHKAAPS